MSDTNTIPPFYVFFKHYNGNATFILNNWIKNGCEMFYANNREDIFDYHDVPESYRDDVEDALSGNAKPFDLSKIDNLDADTKHQIGFFVYSCIQKSRAIETETEPLRQLLVELKDSYWALIYCKYVSDDEDMRKVIIDAGEPEWAYKYCRVMSDNKDMRQVVIDAADPQWAFEYCCYVANDDDMRQVVLDAKNPEWAYYYSDWIRKDNEMRQIILDAGEPEWAYKYIYNLGYDADMRKVILDAKDPKWAYKFALFINKGDANMRQIIIDAGNPEWAHKYCRYVSDDADMRQVALDNKDSVNIAKG